MILCIFISSIVAIVSVFCFFGDAVSISGYTSMPSMFNFMFGTKGSFSSAVVQYNRFPALTFLFCCEIIIIAVAIFALVACLKVRAGEWDKKFIALSALLLIPFTFMAFTTSFCTLTITTGTSTSGVTLGWGSILYGVLQLLVFVSVVTYTVIYIIGVLKKAHRTPKDVFAAEPRPIQTSPSESEKIDLLLKYKSLLDSGVITQEEFDKKKEELLK